MNVQKAVAGRLPVFIAGLYCVLLAVLPVGLSSSAPGAARAGTWLCLAFLPLGLLVPHPRVALFMGTAGVLGSAVVVFAATLWNSGTIQLAPLGVLGFFALSLAWGALSSPAARPGVGQGVRAEWLSARRRIPAWQGRVAATFLLLLPLLLLVALWLDEPAEATFALVVALAVVLALAQLTTEVWSRIWLPDAFVSPQRRRGIHLAAALALAMLAALVGWLIRLQRLS